ncbi:DsbA family protein [Maricaulis sp.]|uniref:2-hydroxychromene-2-carboxylate isomerase n=1 Tax=Maricaulis sp. TaxID=1486257 RepID=UPI00262AFBF6|nr:DsbA family protein [Maricaulis sp.]
MTHTADLYWSFRSPYSYLALPRLIALEAEWDLAFDVRPVRPLALRQPDFFEREHPGWMHYLLTDIGRLASFLGMPLAAPDPDPVVMDESRKRALPEQPYIPHLTRIGIAASEAGRGLETLYAISKRIWSGQAWAREGVLEQALEDAGLDARTILDTVHNEAGRLDRIIEGNEAALEAAGHWGVPTMVYKGEPFFGQDRIELLLWRLKQDGLQPRGETG